MLNISKKLYTILSVVMVLTIVFFGNACFAIDSEAFSKEEVEQSQKKLDQENNKSVQ